MKKLLVLMMLLGLVACDKPREPAEAGSQQETAGEDMAVQPALDELFAEYWEEELANNPLRATFIGDNRYNDLLPNYLSEEEREKEKAFNRKWLEKIKAGWSEELSEQDKLSYQVFTYNLEHAIEGEAFPAYLQPINQFRNPANMFAQLGSGKGSQPFKTAEDYDNFLSRMDGAVAILDQAIANMRAGANKGVVQPGLLMKKVLPQLKAHIVDDVEKSIFYRSVKNMPEEISAEDKDRIDAAYRRMITGKIIPAYQRLYDFIENEYLPATRETHGYLALDNGKEWYRYLVKHHTATDMTPEEIHQFGLDEVARIHGEMEKVMQEVKFEGTLQDFFEHMRTSPSSWFENEEQILAAYEEIRDRVNSQLYKLFEVFPKADYEIRPVEKFRAASASGASYMRPSADGTRPGVFYVNTGNLKRQPTYRTETLSIHEASPGHHFQISIQQEAEGVPDFRRFGRVTAFSEGWALYAETLGKDLGVYTDPYQYYGHLGAQLFRAMRLVVDTGIHYYGWTREEAIDYLMSNSATAEPQAVAEIERYMAIPGQALAYKIGQKVILELRQEAMDALGDQFDIKKFHTQVLVNGALPMKILQQHVRGWIDEQKGA